jgi:hypothetical protein
MVVRDGAGGGHRRGWTAELAPRHPRQQRGRLPARPVSSWPSRNGITCSANPKGGFCAQAVARGWSRQAGRDHQHLVLRDPRYARGALPTAAGLSMTRARPRRWPARIHVNAIAPGPTDTQQPRHGNTESRSRRARGDPAYRIAQPEEIVRGGRFPLPRTPCHHRRAYPRQRRAYSACPDSCAPFRPPQRQDAWRSPRSMAEASAKATRPVAPDGSWRRIPPATQSPGVEAGPTRRAFLAGAAALALAGRGDRGGGWRSRSACLVCWPARSRKTHTHPRVPSARCPSTIWPIQAGGNGQADGGPARASSGRRCGAEGGGMKGDHGHPSGRHRGRSFARCPTTSPSWRRRGGTPVRTGDPDCAVGYAPGTRIPE